MAYYTQEAVDNLFNSYEKCDNFMAYQIDGGLLDNYILMADGYKTAIIKEEYLNDWSSCYNIRMYNKTPKKYEKVIELLDNEEYEKAGKQFFA